jgi:hypothetical protein
MSEYIAANWARIYQVTYDKRHKLWKDSQRSLLEVFEFSLDIATKSVAFNELPLLSTGRGISRIIEAFNGNLPSAGYLCGAITCMRSSGMQC